LDELRELARRCRTTAVAVNELDKSRILAFAGDFKRLATAAASQFKSDPAQADVLFEPGQIFAAMKI
jgi:hypothetical protein